MLRAISGYLGRHHVALLALFLALGGTSVAAANYINGQRIKPGSIPENRLAPAATASFTASEAAVYCRAARSRPRSYADTPCRSRAESVADGFNAGGIAIGTDGNPVVIFGGHPVNLVRCNDRICAGGGESNQEINGTFCGGGGRGEADIAINADGNPIVSQRNGGCVSFGTLNIVACVDPSCAAFAESGHTFDVEGTGTFNSDRDRHGRQSGRQLLRQPPGGRLEGAALQRPHLRRERRHDQRRR